jgi:hypothetical protein
MALDLRKYLAMADAVDADVLTAKADVDAAQSARAAADAAYDDAVTHLNNLTDVQNMMRAVKASAGLKTTESVAAQTTGGLVIDGIAGL